MKYGFAAFVYVSLGWAFSTSLEVENFHRCGTLSGDTAADAALMMVGWLPMIFGTAIERTFDSRPIAPWSVICSAESMKK